MSPKYEAALTLFLTGEHDKAIDYLYQLKNDKKSENDYMNEDYIFLVKKLINYNKIYRRTFHNTPLLIELGSIILNLYSDDITTIFDNIEYVIINLILSDHLEAIKYTEDIIKKEIVPPFFNHIFNYYLGVNKRFLRF